jgi:hypothetical protein
MIAYQDRNVVTMSREQAFERGTAEEGGKDPGMTGAEAGHACKVWFGKERSES